MTRPRARLGARNTIRARIPIVREVFARMDALPGTVDVHSDVAGVDRWTLGKWRGGDHEPRLSSFVALVTALGGRLTIEWTEGA